MLPKHRMALTTLVVMRPQHRGSARLASWRDPTGTAISAR